MALRRHCKKNLDGMSVVSGPYHYNMNIQVNSRRDLAVFINRDAPPRATHYILGPECEGSDEAHSTFGVMYLRKRSSE